MSTTKKVTPSSYALLKKELQPQGEHQTLQQEIENFDRAKLNKQKVHYVSGARYQECPLDPKAHSFIVLANETPTGRKGAGTVYFAGPSIMHATYEVSDQVVLAAVLSPTISNKLKKVMLQLSGLTFPSVEHFLRAVVETRAENAGKKLTQEAIYNLAAYPQKDLQQLVSLNEANLHKRGAIYPLNSKSGRRDIDKHSFDDGFTTNKIYPNIDPMVVRELFEQQKLYQRYLDEKAGIGKATDNKVKENVDPMQTYDIISNLVDFRYVPKPNNEYRANCNKASATILQAAENISARKQHRPAETITAASFWNIGDKQRMYLWNPLTMSLKRIVTNLIDKDHVSSATSTMSTEVLAHKKHDMFFVIKKLPLEQQEKALRQCLDTNTALGKVFHQENTLAKFVKHAPQYYLDKVADRLRDIEAFKRQEAQEEAQRMQHHHRR